VEREIHEAGGVATAIPVDVRYPESVSNMVDEAVKRFGRLDVLIYNSGAIWWSSVERTPTPRFQLMQRVNPEGQNTSAIELSPSTIADARRRPLRHRTDSLAAFQEEQLDRPHCRRQPADL
jgi:NAD(P)-dependent dehydrogenase (short-subunit alcohol dehydrogenase family)